MCTSRSDIVSPIGVSNPAKAKHPSKPEDIARAVSEEVISEIMSSAGDGSISADDEDMVLDEGDVEFSGLVSGSGREEGTLATQNKPGSKMKRLRRMQEEAQKKRQRIDELKSQGAKGADRLHPLKLCFQIISLNASSALRVNAEVWEDVLKEAAGTKVLMNTKRIAKVSLYPPSFFVFVY